MFAMIRNLINFYLIISACIFFIIGRALPCIALNEVGPVKLAWNRLIKVSLHSDGQVLPVATPPDVPSDTGFLLLQGHQLPGLSNTTQSLQLSTIVGFNQSYSIANGHHIGLVTMDTKLARWYVRLTDDESLGTNSSASKDAWLLIVAKAWDEPFPGGCCANSSISPAACNAFGPVLRLSRPTGHYLPLWQLDFEPAAGLLAGHPSERICRRNSHKDSSIFGRQVVSMRYRLYVSEMHRPSDWPEILRLMSNAQDAVAYGHLIGVISDAKHDGDEACCQFQIGSRDNLGLIATVVAERVDTAQFSAYAPVLMLLDEYARGLGDASCLCHGVECRIITILAGCIGLFLCTAGLRFFAASVFLCGFIDASLAVLPVTLRHTGNQLPLAVSLLLGSLIPGLVIGSLALLAWLRKRWQLLAYLVIHLPCCYVLACMLFATPFGRLWWLTGRDAAFFSCLCVALLLCLLLLLLFSSSGAAFSLSFSGAFMLTICLTANLPISSTFPYPFLDLFHRTAADGYNKVLLYYEFRRVSDLVALIAWPAATAICCLAQHRCYNRRRSQLEDPSSSATRGFEPTLPLPPPPPVSSLALNSSDRQRRARQRGVLNVSFGGGDRLGGRVDDERTPLLLGN